LIASNAYFLRCFGVDSISVISIKVFSRNGAWKNEIIPLEKDAFDYSSDLITFLRDNNNSIVGLKIIDVLFKKI